VIGKLWTEVKKDIAFFGSCGFVVGCILVLRKRLMELGIAYGKDWADILFSGFFSFEAYAFIFLALIIVASTDTILKSLGVHSPRLVTAVIHIENRLAQVASSIISFVSGLAVVSLLHSLWTQTLSGIKLFCLLLYFITFLVFIFSTAAFVSHRFKPFDRWWG